MKPLVFLGETFADPADFGRAYPAYRSYYPLVRAGADTPQKIEVALYERSCEAKRRKRRPR